MKTADEILHEHGIAPPLPGKHRYYTICPQCSANRSRAHQKAACLGVTIKGDGVTWGCNHCLWTGGGYYNGKINGPGGEPARTYDYLDEEGKLLSQKVRNPRVAYSESLRGADLVVIPDHDDAGYAHASATAKA